MPDLAAPIEQLGPEHHKQTIGRPFFLDMTFHHTADLPSGARDVDLHVRVLPATGGGC